MQSALAELDLDIRQLRTLLTLGNTEAIALSVQEGLGVGFVSKMVVEKLCQEKVVTIDVEGLEICRDIYFVRNTGFSTTNAQSAFWEFIRNLSIPLSDYDLFLDE